MTVHGLRASRQGRSRGMTLLEIVIALAVFTVVIIVVLKMFPFGRAITVHSSHRLQANRQAQARLETLRASGYAALADGTRVTRATLPDGLPSTTTETIATVRDGSVECWREVHVVVAWSEPGMSPSPGAMDYREEVASCVGRL